jgi:hypothetical protein
MAVTSQTLIFCENRTDADADADADAMILISKVLSRAILN